LKENDIEMTPTSTWSGGDIIPKNDNTFSLGLSNYRWNGEFSNATSANLIVTSSLTVGGQSVCLQNGVNCPVAGSATLQTAYDGTGIGEGRTINLEGGPVTLQWYASGTDLIGSPTTDGYGSLVSKGFGDEGFVLGHTSSSVDTTSTFMFFTSDVNDPFNATTSYISSEVATGDFIIASQGNLGLFAPNQGVINLQSSGGEILLDAPTTTLLTTLIMMGEVASQLVPDLDDTYLLGTSALRWNGFFSNVTTTNLTVGGQSVCLENGVNCPVTGSATLQTAYDGTGIGEGRIIDVEGGAITLQGFASGTNVLSGFPGHEAYNHFEILHASNSQEGIAFGSWRAAGFATGTYMSFASNMSDLTDSGTAFRWDQSGTFAIEQTTTTGGISLIMNDLGFDFNGTTTYSDQSFFNDTVNVAGSILVGGLDVCLIDGTNCPAGSGTLQTAYDGTGIGEGRTIEVEGGPVILQGYASGTNTLAPLFPTYEGYNHFVMLGASSSQSGLAMGSMRLGGVATGTYIAFANDVDDLSADGVFMYGTQDGDFSLLSQNGSSSTSLNVTPDGFLINGTSTFNGLVSITDGLTVGGVNVCLQKRYQLSGWRWGSSGRL
jgi:hypothetical protein